MDGELLMDSDLPYRLCVGIIVFNKQGRVWVGRRLIYKGTSKVTDLGNWQFPQGGVAEDESLETAARRELYEETCIKDLEPIAAYPTALFYDFPSELSDTPIAQKYRGQKQYWFAYLFTGDDSEISISDVPSGNHPEFSEWRWESIEKTVDLIVEFKKDIYKKLVEFYTPFKTKVKEYANNS